MRIKRRYNPSTGPGPWWQALSEGEQVELVEDYHRRKKVELPNERLHAIAHVVIENQVLLGDETPVAAKLEQLMQEGLQRHEAVHAIGSVLMELVWDLGTDRWQDDPNPGYFRAVEELTAEKWLAQFE